MFNEDGKAPRFKLISLKKHQIWENQYHKLNTYIFFFPMTLRTRTGKGIPEEVIDNIFNPLFSTKPTGLGLGLSYVKKVIEAHTGTINVESVVDVGTKFIIIIPQIKSNDVK